MPSGKIRGCRDNIKGALRKFWGRKPNPRRKRGLVRWSFDVGVYEAHCIMLLPEC